MRRASLVFLFVLGSMGLINLHFCPCGWFVMSCFQRFSDRLVEGEFR